MFAVIFAIVCILQHAEVEYYISLKTVLVEISSTFLYFLNIINMPCKCMEMITIILEQGEKFLFCVF